MIIGTVDSIYIQKKTERKIKPLKQSQMRVWSNDSEEKDIYIYYKQQTTESKYEFITQSFDKEDKVYRERGERERWRSEEYNRRRRERRRETLFKMSIAFVLLLKRKKPLGSDLNSKYIQRFITYYQNPRIASLSLSHLCFSLSLIKVR